MTLHLSQGTCVSKRPRRRCLAAPTVTPSTSQDRSRTRRLPGCGFALAILFIAGGLPAASSGATGTKTKRLARNGVIVFRRVRDWPDGRLTSNLCKVSSTGGSPRILVPGDVFDYAAVWSPNGSKFAFGRLHEHLGDRITVANANGSGVREIADGDNPVWSPDRQQR